MARRLAQVTWAGSLAILGIRIASAGPPFLTDDPEPTDPGHWEIYAPTVDAAGRTREFEGSFGAELNYGAAPDVQVTVGIPAGYSHSRGAGAVGRGDFELSVKYRFVDLHGMQIAVFPGLTVPSGSAGFGSSHVTALLPVWFQKDVDAWSWFGGGGFAINPGNGNRNYWTGGIALSHALSQDLTIGFEADRQGADTIEGNSSTSVGFGAILRMSPTVRLLGSAGPTFEDGRGTTLFHLFVALGLDF
jgi:hypothetical protein